MWSLIFSGSLSGLALGLTGGGGSVIAVPLLLYGEHLSAHQAINISLFSVFVTALVGTVRFWRKKELHFIAGLLMVLGGAVGAPFGSALNGLFSPQLLTLLFALLMCFIGARMWQKARKHPAKKTTKNLKENQPISKPWLLFAGLLTGILTGLLGVGGGFLIVPALIFSGRLQLRQAIGTSMLVICITCFVGLTSHLIKDPSFNFAIAGYFSLGSLLGLFLGTKIARHISSQWLQKGLSIALFLVGISMLAEYIL